MAAVLRVPTVLRPAMGNNSVLEVEGSTIGEVLTRLTEAYPTARAQLLSEDGSLHRFLNVYVNDDDVRYLDALETPVKDGDEVSLLPAVAGG